MNITSMFLELMEKGGPIMWIIFMAADVAITLLIWQATKTFLLNRQAKKDYLLLVGNNQFIPEDKNNSPIAMIMDLIDWKQVTNQDELAKQVNISFSEIAPKLEGSLPTIATIGTLLPMLGLLGTVTGMINVFEVVAIHGSGKPDEMAFGISQALLTTAGGLIFAIPVIFLHHLLTRKVNNLLSVTSRAMQIVIHRDDMNIAEGISK